jgi:hypothetical protein
MIAMAGERRNETDRGKALLSNRPLEAFFFEGVRAGGITVEIEDDWRFLDSLRLHHIKIERIAPSPLHAEQFHGVATCSEAKPDSGGTGLRWLVPSAGEVQSSVVSSKRESAGSAIGGEAVDN